MRGQVTFEAAGQDYALHFTINRLCQLEEDTGQGVIAHLGKLDRPESITFIDLRTMFRAGLVGDFTRDQAGDLMQEVGINRVLALVTEAMGAAFEVGAQTSGKPGKAKAGAA